MRATGIVRRVDDLGRVVIPKEIRRTCHIKEGDPLEIFIDETGGVTLKLYQPDFAPWRTLEDIAEEMRDNDDFYEFATDVFALAKKIRKAKQG